ncbi:MAG: hypothetical protein G4V63_18475 [Candidatus Afipia apatlaquensis]|uniref:Uncharacterized protein n=1 Tax=Candidatus Afipia apatlaquensis TaxID=2712852 RepID=A0A7C9VH97_9BRAD|nr:hypothetical protein [Candidatus Afipia apatlaquensis]
MTTSDVGAEGHKVDQEKWRAELYQYRELFEIAFFELHAAVLSHVNKPGQYVGAHGDYPKLSKLSSGFPAFGEFGFFDDNSPRHYVNAVKPRGLMGLLDGIKRPTANFPAADELEAFLRTHDIGARNDWPSDYLVCDAVERYLHLYGLAAPIDRKKLNAVILPLLWGVTAREGLPLRLVAPIALTNIEVDHFQLNDSAYITRIPRRLQLARARMRTTGTGAEGMVVGAATHAFVSTGWSIDVEKVSEVYTSLNQVAENAIDAIDSFFGALRIVTGVETGYAQLLWVPRGWAQSYFCDLTPVFGKALRRYPNEFDNYGWSYQAPSVSGRDLIEVRRIYRATVENESEAVWLALKRLNGCLTRSDAADAILDGTIGLELLLGDDQSQSLAYKLRMRAGALASLQHNGGHTPSQVASKVKKLYEARSAIVHGRRKKGSKQASEPSDYRHAEDRKTASELLRFILDVLLTHPQYLQPSKIDDELLLGRASSHGRPRRDRQSGEA